MTKGWTSEDVRKMAVSPVYCGVGDSTATVSDAKFVKAAVKLMQEIGPRRYLHMMLADLRASLGGEPLSELGGEPEVETNEGTVNKSEPRFEVGEAVYDTGNMRYVKLIVVTSRVEEDGVRYYYFSSDTHGVPAGIPENRLLHWR